MSTKSFRFAEFDAAVWSALTNAFAPNGKPFDIGWDPDDRATADALCRYVALITHDPGPETAQEMADLFQFGVSEAPSAAAERLREFVKDLELHIKAASFRKQLTPPSESFA